MSRAKKTGSSTFEKNFVNGHIIGASLNSKQALASYAAQVIVVDEFDEVLQGKEKSHEDIRTRVRDRASTYGRRARLAYMSMPSDKETSQVYKLFWMVTNATTLCHALTVENINGCNGKMNMATFSSTMNLIMQIAM